MTTEPTPEPTERPEPEEASPAVEQHVATPPPAPATRERAFNGSGFSRTALGVIAAALIFAGGFAVGHLVVDRHDHDRRPPIAARANRFMQDMRNHGEGQSRNGPQMGQAPNLQQLLPLLQQLLNNRNGGNGNNGSS